MIFQDMKLRICHHFTGYCCVVLDLTRNQVCSIVAFLACFMIVLLTLWLLLLYSLLLLLLLGRPLVSTASIRIVCCVALNYTFVVTKKSSTVRNEASRAPALHMCVGVCVWECVKTCGVSVCISALSVSH